jgi:hypothetical protein
VPAELLADIGQSRKRTSELLFKPLMLLNPAKLKTVHADGCVKLLKSA